MIASSSRPISPSSPACGLRPAMASRGFAMPKSRFSAASTISAGLDDGVCRDRARALRASGMWMVSGTTRSRSLASIITARVASGQMRQEFGVAGKAKPACDQQALLIGAVTIAAAAPATPLCTAISMASMTAGAFAASGLPGTRVARARRSRSAGSPDHRRRRETRRDRRRASTDARRCVRPVRDKPRQRPPVRSAAGSPMVTRIGRLRSRL